MIAFAVLVILYTSVLLDGMKVLIEMEDTEPWD